MCPFRTTAWVQILLPDVTHSCEMPCDLCRICSQHLLLETHQRWDRSPSLSSSESRWPSGSQVTDKTGVQPRQRKLQGWRECPHTVDAEEWEYHACVAPWKGQLVPGLSEYPDTDNLFLQGSGFSISASPCLSQIHVPLNGSAG